VTHITVRLYGSLNDFVPRRRRHVAWPVALERRAAVKDVLEGLGVPHPEIDLVLVDGVSVPFDHAVKDGDRIAVFPRFQAIDIALVTRVRPAPADPGRFVLDVHLGRLARHLRLAGLDAVYDPAACDADLAALAGREGRVLLTRDRGLLKRSAVVHGYFVRETAPYRQLVEVLDRFGPLPMRPFSRCLRCNAEVRDVPKSAVDARLPARTRGAFHEFFVCVGCGRVYWKGSHWARLTRLLGAAIREAERGLAAG
jgi:uncharacterized protein with PIN domain